MQETSIFGFQKAEKSDTGTGWLDSLNANWDKLDAMPLPLSSGRNTQLYYQKFGDGTAHLWGCIDYGNDSKYRCYRKWSETSGWASDAVTVTFPFVLADTTYSVNAFVQTDKNPDMWCVSNGHSANGFYFCFLCGVNESTSADGINTKRLNLDIWGRWE